jgi:hypothetical protein
MEIDGIQLDANAAAQLGDGADGSGSLSAYPPDPTDKMLKQHEADDLDGIALDTHAASVLHRARIHAMASRKARGNRGRNAKGDIAQQLLEKGEQELDSSRYRSAVQDLRKARDMWKKEGRDDWHWAQTLVDDVKRAHPKLAASKPRVIAVIQGDEAQQTQEAPPMQAAQNPAPATGQSLIKNAAKELASGAQFRSLYGLARDEEAKRSGTPRWSPPAESAPVAPRLSQSHARTSALSQLPAQTTQESGKQSVLNMALDSAVKEAEKRLIHQNKIALLHEEAAIRRRAAQILQASQNSLQQPQAAASRPTAAVKPDPLDQQRWELLRVIQPAQAIEQPQTVVQQQMQTVLAPPVTYSQQVAPQTAAVSLDLKFLVCLFSLNAE